MSWGHLIDDRPDEGMFRVHRDAFRDPAVFDREMTQFCPSSNGLRQMG